MFVKLDNVNKFGFEKKKKKKNNPFSVLFSNLYWEKRVDRKSGLCQNDKF